VARAPSPAFRSGKVRFHKLQFRRARHQIILPEQIVFQVFRCQCFALSAQLLELGRITSRKNFNQFDERSDRALNVRAVKLDAENWNIHTSAVKCDIFHLGAKPRTDDVRITPRIGEGTSGGGGRYLPPRANERPT